MEREIEGLDLTKTSKFNTAILKMSRLHENLDKLNRLRQIPLGIDEETGEESYLVMLRCLNSLFLETYPNLDPKDRNRGEDLKKAIESYLDKFPVKKILLKDGKITNKSKFFKENWEMLSKGLFIYEKMIREFISKTGMDTEEKEFKRGL